ncbi:MAG: peptidoglycan DD-metalloendopeptidase family protein [Alphaproteobacteria bacterium]
MATAWRRAIRRLVPERREIILRSRGQVRYLRLPRWLQITAIAAAAALVGWTATVTDRYFDHAGIVGERDQRIAAATSSNRVLVAELEAARRDLVAARRAMAESKAAGHANFARVEELEADLARRQSSVDALMAERDGLRAERDDLATRLASLGEAQHVAAGERARLAASLAEAQERLAAVSAERDRLTAYGESLSGRVEELSARVGALDSERGALAGVADDLRRQLAEATSAHDLLAARRADLESEVAGLQRARDEIVGRLGDADRQLVAVAGERDRLREDRDRLGAQVAALSERLVAFADSQRGIVERLDERTTASLAVVSQTLAGTGVDVDRLLERLGVDGSVRNDAGVGGPFLPLPAERVMPPTMAVPGDALGNKLAKLDARLTYWEGVQAILARLPLAPPLDSFQVTSGFGRRIDPFTGQWAMHEGLDLSAPERTLVYATAPGTVTFVGWKGGYGKMVEIDHGLGIRTRYGHMRKLYLRKGQEIEFGEKVGEVGSTGRSSAPHLHYEVAIDGRAQDPDRFIKAGRHVFKE